MIYLSRPQIGDEEKRAVIEVLDSGMIAQGPRVKEFEDRFAAYCGCEHAIATSSGTTALHLALLAHGIGPGDEVVTTPFSFFATASAIIMAGARPVFADIEPDTFNIDPKSVEKVIGKRTRAIIPVHLFGHPADMAALCAIADDHQLALIEDSAQAHGADIAGKRCGTFGTGCFSFYATKNMTSCEGGVITTSDGNLAEQLRSFRNHGMRRRYHHDVMGYNYRMTDLNAAVGLVQLDKLVQFNKARQANAVILNRLLSGIVGCPATRKDTSHVYHQYTVRIPRFRDAVMEQLRETGVGCDIFYPVPLYRQPPVAEYGFGGEPEFPETERAIEEVLSLPVHPGLSDKDLETISSALRDTVASLAKNG